MRKKFTIFLILIFILGLGYIYFSHDANAMRINYCTLDNWVCEDWGTCSPEGIKTRVCNKITSCVDNTDYTPFATTLSCSTSECTKDTWSCDDWSECSINREQTRICTKTFDCELVDTPSPNIQSCELTKPIITSISPKSRSDIYPDSEITITGENFNTYGDGTYCNLCNIKVNGVSVPMILNYTWLDTSIVVRLPSDAVSGYITVIDKNGIESNQFDLSVIPYCSENNWSCSDWSDCSQNGRKTRTCNKILNCDGDVSSPITAQTCVYFPSCTISDWTCSGWSICAQNDQQTRICVHTPRCLGGVPSPAFTQACTHTPACSQDTWECGNWGTCSPQGIQARSCSRTYDCPSAETAAPATSQYCESSYQQNYQTPSTDSNIVVNQDTIIKATVKLVCPVSSTMASQGSGTVINSTGLILTNKHVIDGTAGCWVGFIDDYDDEPYFGDRQIADIYKVSSDADIAVLKLRNPNNKTLISVNISQSNSSSIQLGEILTTYGYPAKFGTKITYTSGDFSGVDGNYLKTTAIIEHGNSGGGAYLKNGAFIGIPTAVVKGSLNSMGYLMSVNKINSWLNNSIAYNYNSSNNNNYSRVSSMLEDMDLSAINSLGLFVAGDEANIKTATESQKVIAEEKSLITKIDNNLSKRVSGNILLQVEKNGEGWYVYPDNKKKYYLGRPADAFNIMRKLGLGISENSFSSFGNYAPSRLSGKILLRVEKNGEAYYVNPTDLKMHYLGRPDDAFQVMRELGLGITNSDIRKIDVGEVE